MTGRVRDLLVLVIVVIAALLGTALWSSGTEVRGLDLPPATPDTRVTPDVAPAPAPRARAVATEGPVSVAPSPEPWDPPVPQEPPEPDWAEIRVTCGDRAVADCWLSRPGDPLTALDLSSTREGVYRISLARGTELPLSLLVHAPGYGPVHVDLLRRGEVFDVRLPRGATVQGRIRSEDLSAVGPATIFLAGRIATSDRGGDFVFHHVQPGVYRVVHVDLPGASYEIESETVVRAAGEVVRLDLTLPPSGRFPVHVVRTSGPPVADALVRMTAIDGTSQELFQARTDAEGVAWMQGVRSGEYWLCAEGEGIEPAYLERVRVPTTNPVVVRAADRVLHRIFGRLVRADGSGVPGIPVRWHDGRRSLTSTTDKAGRFSIEGAFQRAHPGLVLSPDPPPMQISVGVPGRLIAPDYTVEWDREILITVPSATTIQGTVKVAGESKVPPFDVLFETQDGGYFMERFVPGSRAGQFTFKWTTAPSVTGRLTVVLRDGQRRSVDVTPSGKATDVGTIDFTAVGSVRMRITGDPLPDSVEPWLSWCAPGTVQPLGGTSLHRSDDAWTSTSAIPGGRFRFLVVVPGFLVADAGTHEVPVGHTIDLRAELSRPRDLTVVVVANGETVPGARVELGLPEDAVRDELRLVAVGTPGLHRYSGAGVGLSATTDERGRAVFARLPRGPVRVSVRRTGASAPVAFDVTMETVDGGVLQLAVER